MSPAPEGWQGAPASPDGFYQLYSGPERAYLAKRLVPGEQYCARVKAANSEVRGAAREGVQGWEQLAGGGARSSTRVALAPRPCLEALALPRPPHVSGRPHAPAHPPLQGESAWSPLGVFYTQATVPSWAPSDAPFVWDTTASSITLGWPEPAANGGTVTGYEVWAAGAEMMRARGGRPACEGVADTDSATCRSTWLACPPALPPQNPAITLPCSTGRDGQRQRLPPRGALGGAAVHGTRPAQRHPLQVRQGRGEVWRGAEWGGVQRGRGGRGGGVTGGEGGRGGRGGEGGRGAEGGGGQRGRGVDRGEGGAEGQVDGATGGITRQPWGSCSSVPAACVSATACLPGAAPLLPLLSIL